MSGFLGMSNGVEALGEVAQLPQKYSSGAPCTCGAPLSTCPVWSRVIKLHQDLERGVYPHSQIFDAVRQSLPAAQAFVDSSKRLGRLKELVSEGLQPVVVHLIRDGRAVARSEKRKGRSGLLALIKWASFNHSAMNFFASYDGPKFRLRLEDFLANPPLFLNEIQPALRSTMNFSGTRIDFSLQHHVGGNRVRFNGPTELKKPRSAPREMPESSILRRPFFGSRQKSMRRFFGDL